MYAKWRWRFFYSLLKNCFVLKNCYLIKNSKIVTYCSCEEYQKSSVACHHLSCHPKSSLSPDDYSSTTPSLSPLAKNRHPCTYFCPLVGNKDELETKENCLNHLGTKGIHPTDVMQCLFTVSNNISPPSDLCLFFLVKQIWNLNCEFRLLH